MRCLFSRRVASFGTLCTVSARLIRRDASTAPPLSLLSWSVDGTCHAQHRYPRRLSLKERLPLLCETILEAAPDVVALQDSLPEVANALTSSSSYCSPCTVAQTSSDNTGNLSNSLPLYELLGTVRNGKCGFLQLFQRRDSPWCGHLLPHFPCLTAEFTSRETQTRFVLTNVDLTYRGKSLSIGGLPLTSPEVSRDGSPFTLRVGTSQTPSPQTRVKGQLDTHREAALTFISRVARPDVMMGNFYMGREESMPGYEDAWVLAGAPAEHERTTNTFAEHKDDAETNAGYFLPRNEGIGRHATSQREHPAQEEKGEEKGDTDIAANAEAGIPIPLYAVSGEGDHGWAVASALSSACTTPEVAGRYQRCLLRRRGSQHHRQQLPFCRRYERTQLVLRRPFLEVPRTPEELQRSGDGATTVRCSVSDQFPILVMLS